MMLHESVPFLDFLTYKSKGSTIVYIKEKFLYRQHSSSCH